MQALSERGVPTAVHYPLPCHAQAALMGDLKSEAMNPISTELSARVLSLPMHTEMDEEQIVHVERAVGDVMTSERS